jgi:hypothetical protein
VLTVEPAVGHLGTVMTQFAVLYALSRRDGRHAFLPPGVELALRQPFPAAALPPLSDLRGCSVQFLPLGLDQYEKMRLQDPLNFRLTSVELKRGPNRARLYHRYRPQLAELFLPAPRYSERTDRLLAQYLDTHTRPGEDRVVVSIYLEAEDFEYMKKMKKTTKSYFVIHAIQHFQGQYRRPIFLIRCSNYVWCLQRFLPDLESGLLAPGQRLADLKVFLPDSGLVWKYVEDFALLSGSNHTVVLRSHLAWWMAYLSPGPAALPDIESSILGNVKSLGLPWHPLPF